MSQYNYRDRIYPKYTSQKMTQFVNLAESDYLRWDKTTLRYIQGWLPNNTNAQCLDVACGAGHMVHLLKSNGFRNITGIDISPEQVATTRKIWPDIIEANALAYLAQHKNTFDLITGFDIIEHFTKDELFDFLDKIYDALAPGGILILQTPNAESPFGLSHRYHDLTHEIAFDSHSISHLLSVVGFSGIQARECGPIPHGLKSLARTIIWRLIRYGLMLYNLAETGQTGSGIFSRVFLIHAIKQL